MKRQTFLEWLTEGKYRGLYGQPEGDEKAPSSMLDRIQDNDIAEGDWEQQLTDLVMKWAGLPSGSEAKEIYKQKIDDFAARLLQMGNSPARVASIINRSTHDQRGSFIRTATQHGRRPLARM